MDCTTGQDGTGVATGWDAVFVTGPWGNNFVVHALNQPAAIARLPPLDRSKAAKMESAHYLGAASFGVRGGPGDI